MSALVDFVTPGGDTPKGWEAGVEVAANGGSITSGPVTEPIKDWAEILLLWNLDPKVFEVVEPVTFKAWDGYAKEEYVDPDSGAVSSKLVSKRLYSYRARIQMRDPEAVSEKTLERWHKKLLALGVPKVRRAAGAPATYVIAVADAQLGKKGTAQAVENWKRGVRGHVERIKRLADSGQRIGRILVAFQGDEHEQVANNYANQSYTVELNMSEQIELDFSLRVWTIEQVAVLALPVLVTSVISNHGEWTRNGDKEPVTSKADNSSTCVARLVRELVARVPGLAHVEFNIAKGSPDIVVDISGVKMVLSHGHIAKGKGSTTEQRTKNAIERQILGRTEEIGDAQIYLTAHYHHFYMQEFEGRTLFGCPALEAEKSSEYMLEQYGVWSPPGMLGFMVSSEWSRGWAEVAVL